MHDYIRRLYRSLLRSRGKMQKDLSDNACHCILLKLNTGEKNTMSPVMRTTRTDKSERANDWPKFQLTWLKYCSFKVLAERLERNAKTINVLQWPPTTSRDPQSKGRVQVVVIWRHSICSLFVCQYAPAAATKSWTARASRGGFTFRRWAKGTPCWNWQGSPEEVAPLVTFHISESSGRSVVSKQLQTIVWTTHEQAYLYIIDNDQICILSYYYPCSDMSRL